MVLYCECDVVFSMAVYSSLTDNVRHMLLTAANDGSIKVVLFTVQLEIRKKYN